MDGHNKSSALTGPAFWQSPAANPKRLAVAGAGGDAQVDRAVQRGHDNLCTKHGVPGRDYENIPLNVMAAASAPVCRLPVSVILR